MSGLAESFNQSGFSRFINSPAGRIVRLAAGIVLLAVGYAWRDQGMGVFLMILGLVPLAAGIFNWCWISAVLGGPLSGSKIRSRQT